MNLSSPVKLPVAIAPRDRIDEFIMVARDKLDCLIDPSDWNLEVWPIRGFVTKGQNRNNPTLIFCRHGSKIARHKLIDGEPLAGAFAEFAKALIKYTHATERVSYENLMLRLNALQFIEAAFRSLDLEPRIEDLSVVVLNTAVALSKSGVGSYRHYQFAMHIQRIYKLCLDRLFLNGPFQWKHGVRKETDKIDALGKEAKEWREKRLPSPEAFSALGHIFRNADDFMDRLWSSVCAIMVSIPIRVHEALQLRLDCEVYGTTTSPETGETVDAYGIRVWPGKGNPPQVKWVPTAMASAVQEAVARLREMCAPAREIARWYEENPITIWLPEGLAGLRRCEWVKKSDFARLLGMTTRTSANQYLKLNPSIRWRTTTARAGNIDEINFGDLQDNVLSLLPETFPHFNGHEDQLFSQTLIVNKYNGAHRQRATFECMIEACTVPALQEWLMGNRGRTVFERWGFTERDGSRMRVTTHAFRHWLNTVAQLRGLSDLDIAKWSGRDPAQNKAYNHVTADEVVSQIRAAIDDGNVVGPMFEAAKNHQIKEPVDRNEFMNAQVGSALLTDFGFCVHDYSLLPCQNYGNCLGCSENVFIKGDADHRAKTAQRLALTETQLAKAEAALDANIYGADRWCELHRQSITRMRRILAIHDDPAIPDGTIVSPEDNDQDNDVAMAFRDRLFAEQPSMGETEATTRQEIELDLWGD